MQCYVADLQFSQLECCVGATNESRGFSYIPADFSKCLIYIKLSPKVFLVKIGMLVAYTKPGIFWR